MRGLGRGLAPAPPQPAVRLPTLAWLLLTLPLNSTVRAAVLLAPARPMGITARLRLTIDSSCSSSEAPQKRRSASRNRAGRARTASAPSRCGSRRGRGSFRPARWQPAGRPCARQYRPPTQARRSRAAPAAAASRCARPRRVRCSRLADSRASSRGRSCAIPSAGAQSPRSHLHRRWARSWPGAPRR